MNNHWKIANAMRYSARVGSSLLGLVIFTFALLSGSEEYGGGLSGIIQNSPNTLPY